MRRAAILVIGLALVLRLGLFAVVACCPQRYLAKDSPGYIRASNLSAAYTEPKSPAFIASLERIVGYPLFIAVTRGVTRSLLGVLLAQIAIGVATVVLLLRQQAWLGGRGALIAGALLAIEPLSILHANQVLSEILFAFLITAATLVLLNAIKQPEVWRFAVAGLFFSWAALTRPIALYIPLVFLPVTLALLSKDRPRALFLAATLAFAYLLPVGAWMVHVHETTGTWVFSTIEGRQFLSYRAAGAVAAEKGISRTQADERLQHQFHASSATFANPARESQAQRAYGVRVLLHHPVGLLKTTVHGLAKTSLDPSVGSANFRRAVALPDALRLRLRRVEQGFTLLMWGTSAVGVWAFIRERRWDVAAIPAATIAYLLILSAGPEGFSRYRTVMVPLMCFLAGKGASVALERLQSRGTPAASVAQRRHA